MEPLKVLIAEWFDNQWVVIADADSVRGSVLQSTISEIGFPAERILVKTSAVDALASIIEKNSAIVLLDDSVGTGGFKEIHARLTERFGASGFFLFTVTAGDTPDFTQFAATARIDGIIFRPYAEADLQRRLSEVFSIKWPNRYIEPEGKSDTFEISGKSDAEIFEKALEKEKRLGYRDTLTPDPKFVSIFGLKRTEHPGIKHGKASFERVTLSFRAVAVNGQDLEKPVPVHAMELDDTFATFECGVSGIEAGDNLSLEAEIVHGEECYTLRIEAKITGQAGAGLISIEFDEGNRTRFEAAMRMVAKRFEELKDFFKYAKGA